MDIGSNAASPSAKCVDVCRELVQEVLRMLGCSESYNKWEGEE